MALALTLVASWSATALAQSSGSDSTLYGRVSSKDIDLNADYDWDDPLVDAPRGLYGSETTLWVSEAGANWAFAFWLDSIGRRNTGLLEGA